MNKVTTLRTNRPTLKDVARTAGVSISTVSIVLAGKAAERRISAQVVERVRQVAAQQDYAPNLLMHSLRQGRTQILSFYNGYGYRNRGDLYMDRLTTALEYAAGTRHYDILTHCDYSRPVYDIYHRLNGGHSDGLIFFGPQQDDPLLTLLRASRLPTVVFAYGDEKGILSSVSDDMPAGIRRLADELVAQGHRRIAALADPWPDATARLAVLREHLGAQGITLRDDRIFRMTEELPALDNLLRSLMDAPDPPTALFCWHDRAGYLAIDACERLGIAVPEQLSLVGYDGLHWPSLSRHILTSVAVDLDALAEAAVVLLQELIAGEFLPPKNVVLPVTLLPGTTLGPALG